MRLNYWVVALGLCAALALSRSAAQELTNRDCLECHNDKDLTKTNQVGKVISLFIDEAKLAGSIHRTNSCVSCHSDLKSTHPDDNVALLPVDCASCHDKAAKEYAGSIHGVSRSMGASAAATCVDCHGTHNILSAKNVDSSVFKLNLPQTCARCHSNPGMTKEYEMKYPQVASQ